MAEAEGSSPLLVPPLPPPPGMAEVEVPTAAETDMKQYHGSCSVTMDVERSRFPYCVVWTPIPVLTWFFPIIGHMGICTSTGVIRDFAGPYFVSEDNMAFGKPAKYWKLDPAQVYASGPNAWDTAVHDASEEYKHRMHNLCCDNCHSHVALALNLMRYNNSTNWNMVTLCFFCLLYGKYIRTSPDPSRGSSERLSELPVSWSVATAAPRLRSQHRLGLSACLPSVPLSCAHP
ncbi:transmembrane protein 222 isoform X1 [Octodon degus]|uniref:Transmembrane protein 222 isoform X1 n=1 Tax=Octodon degus TaxID=10160 RepID=A0A6P6DFU6_OCTDE|nr:transmembrane protein 222 isoform X1 [Octodon degus]